MGETGYPNGRSFDGYSSGAHCGTFIEGAVMGFFHGGRVFSLTKGGGTRPTGGADGKFSAAPSGGMQQVRISC